MTSRVLSALIALLAVLAAPSGTNAQDVGLPDLAGVSIEADIDRDQVVQREGRTFSVRIKQTWEIQVGADQKTIATKVGTIATTPRGTRTARPNAGSFVMGEPRPVPSRGGGTAAWNFADGTLTFTRTFPSGAFRAHVAFTHGPEGLTCTATEAFARENGGRPIRLQSAFGGEEVLMISSKQVGSRCKVVKAP